ncbi:MAG: hypothetical protein WD066_04110 [Planctomycetaceae bacterium]
MSMARFPAWCAAAAVVAVSVAWLGGDGADAQQSSAASQVEIQPAQPRPRAAREEPAKPRTAEEKKALSEHMRAKLAASSEILEGLCTEDFDLIAKGAKELGRVSATEKWRISNDAIYRHHSAEFTRVVKELEKSAGEKSLEGCSLRWVEATMTCIECHRFVRAIMIAGDE